MEFLDRIEERARLSAFLDDASGGFACLYGRRRCGKTRLLEECLAGRTEAFYHLAELKAKAALLPFAKAYRSVEPVIFVAEGGDFDCVDLGWCEE